MLDNEGRELTAEERLERFALSATESIARLRSATKDLEKQRESAHKQFADGELKKFMEEHQRMLAAGQLSEHTVEREVEEGLECMEVNNSDEEALKVHQQSAHGMRLAFSKQLPLKTAILQLRLSQRSGGLAVKLQDGKVWSLTATPTQRNQAEDGDDVAAWEVTLLEEENEEVSFSPPIRCTVICSSSIVLQIRMMANGGVEATIPSSFQSTHVGDIISSKKVTAFGVLKMGSEEDSLCESFADQVKLWSARDDSSIIEEEGKGI